MSDKKEKAPSVAAVVCKVVFRAGATFWRGPDGEKYVTMQGEGRMARYPVRSKEFKSLVTALVARHMRQSDDLPGTVSANVLSDALNVLESYALDGPEREPRVRVCGDGEGGSWLDLGDESWQLVHVDAAGWQVVSGADVPLLRASGMRPLPRPEHSQIGVGLARLRGLLNLDGDTELMLIVSWLVAALHPTGPYTVLAIDGEHGSGKSTASKMLRRLVDPNLADARAVPHNQDDLLIAARNGQVCAFDNGVAYRA